MECTPITPEAIRTAALLLRGGALAIIPTDTVYGLVADVRRADGVRAIYAAKGKGEASPLQLLFAPDLAQVRRYGELSANATALVEGLGPGGWTIVVEAVAGWDSPALAGGRTVGVRIPAAAVVHELVRLVGAPLAASSANRHGERSPTTCAAAVRGVGDACAIALDGAEAPAGLDSTVIDCTAEAPRILREGAIDRQTVARILGLDQIPVLRSVRP